MFSKILVPVDLEHTEDLTKGLGAAMAMAQNEGAEIVYMSVFGGAPTPVAKDQTEFNAAMQSFAAQHTAPGVKTSAMPLASHDTPVELTELVLDAAEQSGADLIVMGSHTPGWLEHVFHSNAGYVACHAPMSVMVVR